MYHSSTSTYISNFIEIEETFCGRSDVRTDGRTFETHFIRSTRRSRPNSRFVNLASGVAYVGGRTCDGREQAAGADGRRAQTSCGRG